MSLKMNSLEQRLKSPFMDNPFRTGARTACTQPPFGLSQTGKSGAGRGIRTPDPLITNQLLWPTELCRQWVFIKAGNRVWQVCRWQEIQAWGVGGGDIDLSLMAGTRVRLCRVWIPTPENGESPGVRLLDFLVPRFHGSVMVNFLLHLNSFPALGSRNALFPARRI